MGIQKQIVTPDGIVSNYFTIESIIQQFLRGGMRLTIQIRGFADQSYFTQNKSAKLNEPLYANTYREVFLLINDQKGYSRKDIYKRIVDEVPEFSGGIVDAQDEL